MLFRASEIADESSRDTNSDQPMTSAVECSRPPGGSPMQSSPERIMAVGLPGVPA